MISRKARIVPVVYMMTTFVLSNNVFAGKIADTDLNTFTAGTPAVANEVNQNFNEVRIQVNDNDARIADIAARLPSGGKKIISIPTQAMSVYNGFLGNGLVKTPNGLRWKEFTDASANFTIHKPADYSGGNVTLTLLFATTSSNVGTVGFTVFPSSLNNGGNLADLGGTAISPSSLAVSGKNQSVHEYKFTLPAADLARSWWDFSITREGNAEYTDDVEVRAVSLTY